MRAVKSVSDEVLNSISYTLTIVFVYARHLSDATSSLFHPRNTGMSPFRQRAAKNLFTSYIFNGYRRLSSELVFWVIPFAIGTSSRASRDISFLGRRTHCSLRLRHVCVGEALRRVAEQQGGACCGPRLALRSIERV